MSKPTRAQVHAVQHALYKHKRLEKLFELQRQVALVMNLNRNAQLPTNDVRYPAGSGPQWFYPDTGGLDMNVEAGANLCDQIASTILAMRSDVAGVSFPPADKQHLMTALGQEAAAWKARGRHWRDPKPPNVDAVVNEISGHFNASIDAVKHVQRYLKPKHELGL